MRHLTSHPARLAWRSDLSEYHGIVYLVDPGRPSQSKEELDGILRDDKVTKPVLVLGPKSYPSGEEGPRQYLDLPDTTKVCDLRIILKQTTG